MKEDFICIFYITLLLLAYLNPLHLKLTIMQKKKLEIDLATAKKLYKTASSEFKTLLENNFTKQELSSDLKDIINNYEDACKHLNIEPLKFSGFHSLYPTEKEASKAYYQHQIETIIKCFNGNWTPDFSNRNQYKYRPWFERKSSGWVVYSYDCTGVYSRSGSGLYFEKQSDALYVANKFINLYSEILE